MVTQTVLNTDKIKEVNKEIEWKRPGGEAEWQVFIYQIPAIICLLIAE